MAREYRTSFRAYSAWNYEKEIEDLNEASEKGWQLVKGGCFSSRFVKETGIRYRYQLDYRRIEDMGRYIETFREQGWEYINSTFNGWHYFRKMYDPALPEEAYEIFTDRESLMEMNGRWARLALGIGIVLALFAVFYAVRMIARPNLPTLIHVLVFAIESAVLLRGCAIMRSSSASRSRRGSSAFLAVFFAVIILGAAAGVTMSSMRPHFTTSPQSASIDQPFEDEQQMSFEIRYPDSYYFNLEMESAEPMTFRIVNEDGAPVYAVKQAKFSEEDIRLKLPAGQYRIFLSCSTGFRMECDFE